MTLVVCFLSFHYVLVYLLNFHYVLVYLLNYEFVDVWFLSQLYLKLGPGFNSILVPPLSRSIPPITRQKRRPLELQCKQSFRLDHVRDADA